MSHPLPSTRDLLTSLVSSLQQQQQQQQQQAQPGVDSRDENPAPSTSSFNPLRCPPAPPNPHLRHVLLTLHVHFPNELLPALDLLDRGLVTRLRVCGRRPAQTAVAAAAAATTTEAVPEPASESKPAAATAVEATQFLVRSGAWRTSASRRRGGHPTSSSSSSSSHARHHDGLVSRDDDRGASSPPASGVHPSLAATMARGGGPLSGGSGSHYDVRLDAWSCSCPAFTFAAFRPASASSTSGGLAAAAAPPPLIAEDGGDRAPPQVGGGQWRDSDRGFRRGVGVLRGGDGRGDGGDDHESSGGESWAFGGLALGEEVPLCKHLLACVLVERTEVFSHFVEERWVGTGEVAGWAAGWGD